MRCGSRRHLWKLSSRVFPITLYGNSLHQYIRTWLFSLSSVLDVYIQIDRNHTNKYKLKENDEKNG
jgi:hypothetical protein